MILRKLRWLAALALAVAAPSVSSAATTILVEETGGGFFSQSYTLATLPTSISTPSFTDVRIGLTTTSDKGARANHNLSTSLVGATSGTFQPGAGLRITVTDDGFLNANPGSDGYFVGSVTTTAADAFTANVGAAALTGPPVTTTLAATANATPSTGGSADFITPEPTSPNVSAIPNQYTIQQILAFRVTQITQSDGSFTAGVSTSVRTETAAVPAPPALLLALAAIPALGLRRVLARKA